MDYGIDVKEDKSLLYRKLTNDKVINIVGESGSGKSTLCEKFKNDPEYIVIDYDLINLHNHNVGSVEYELVQHIISKYGDDLFPTSDRKNGQKVMMIDATFIEKLRMCFTTTYLEIINYLKPRNKTIVIDASQIRFINDVSLLKGEFVVLRTSIDRCISQAHLRHKKSHPSEDEESLKKHLTGKREIVSLLNPYLNEVINKTVKLNINNFNSSFKENLLEALNNCLSNLNNEEFPTLKTKNIILIDNAIDIIPTSIGKESLQEQLLINRSLNNCPFLIIHDSIICNLDTLYLNNYSKIEDIVNLFQERLNKNLLEQNCYKR